ncbi:MAG: UDP-glucose/GDP-mannose dehydrogenase family protein [Rhizomicrobium sp.]
MRIAVFGLGYVGTVSAACLAERGHDVTGVDKSQTKVAFINNGETPVIEAEVAGLIARARADGRLRATTDAADAVGASDLSLICVGTPSARNGNLDVSAIRAVCEEIGAALKGQDRRHHVVIRSTVLPGTLHDVVIPALEAASGKRAHRDFGVGVNPEFLREGTAVRDFHNPPKTVIGATDADTIACVTALYEGLPGPLIVFPPETAEMVKYADNCWHALKVAFANEIGNICQARGVDSHALMDAFVQDTKLNISPVYLKPGFAFGGSCLPKDCRALTYFGRSHDLELPVLDAILKSNVHQVERALQKIVGLGGRRISLLGLSFKEGTDDLRESPLVELAERLIGKGYQLRIFDRNVQLARLVGANRDYILHTIPHLSDLMLDTVDAAIGHAEILVVGNRDPAFASLAGRLTPQQTLVDLVRFRELETLGGNYIGINW